VRMTMRMEGLIIRTKTRSEMFREIHMNGEFVRRYRLSLIVEFGTWCFELICLYAICSFDFVSSYRIGEIGDQ